MVVLTPQRQDTAITVVTVVEKEIASSLPLGATSSISATPSPVTASTPVGITTTAVAANSELLPLRDGGPKAWLVVLGSFLIHSFAFAPTEYIFGIFELHYQIIYPKASASSIAFVGTTGSAVTYLAGFLAGMVADRFGFRRTALCGTVIMTLSLVLASFARHLWILYLTQGVMFGIGASLAYYPAIAAPSHYFSKKRGLATGLAVSGVGVGGLVLAPLTHSLIDNGIASLLIVERKEHFEAHGSFDVLQQEDPESDKAKEDDHDPDAGRRAKDQHEPSFLDALKVFKDARFLSLSLAELAASIGVLIPLYYMQTYAVFIGLSPEKGALVLGLSNGASFAGRVVLGLIADYVSNVRMLLLCSWATAFAVLVLWTIAKSFGTLLLMGLTFGFFAGGYVSLVPVAVAQSFGTKQMASTIGLMYAAAGLGMLGGAPLAGYLLDVTRPTISYLPVTLTAGSTMTLGAIGVSSWAYFNWRSLRARRTSTATTAITVAARYGSTECLDVLLYFEGIDVNIKNRLEGETPLHKAAAYEDPDIALQMVETLINGGALTTIQNKHRQTPYDKAPSDTHGAIKEYLENAALGSHFDARDIEVEDPDSDSPPSDEE
ncbi:hypothetical protein BGZ83_011289 [Gryganskiella cystojenkinii]|nr:hypothetical protein BGZ83_011289 [Gryganskiella cystojenkinii]